MGEGREEGQCQKVSMACNKVTCTKGNGTDRRTLFCWSGPSLPTGWALPTDCSLRHATPPFVYFYVQPDVLRSGFLRLV